MKTKKKIESSTQPKLTVKNANEHNLKNVSVEIPRDQFVVMTGVSGSGKSSLAFDTIFKEGQRRYIASLSSYARQFIQNIDRPNVDSVDGLSPTICIDQKSAGRNPRSTVGTITEVYDFLRLLFSRLGTPHCPNGHGPISSQTVEVLIRNLQEKFKGQVVLIMSPLVIDRKGEYKQELAQLRESGFVRILIDGKLYRLDEEISLARYEKHTLEVVIDRVEVSTENHSRIYDAIQKSVDLSQGKISLLNYKKLTEKKPNGYYLTNILNACSVCGESVKEMEPKLFSFNSPQDACKDCQGLGYIISFDVDKFITDPEKPIFGGALAVLNPEGNVLYTRQGHKQISKILDTAKIDPSTPWKDYPKEIKNEILIGPQNKANKKRKKTEFSCLALIEKIYKKYNIGNFKRFQTQTNCRYCDHSGLNQIALNVLFQGNNIAYFNRMQIKDLHKFFNEVDLSAHNKNIWEPILKEIKERLFFLTNVGLEYLTLNRRANTLSGGEAQRIRLASQIGSGLEGCLYVLDEPSIGLHSIDNEKLIQTLLKLKDRDNSLIVIEHDEDTMLASDYLVELGPKAGIQGGEITFSGKPTELKKFLNKSIELKNHPTAAYLLGAKNITTPPRRPLDKIINFKQIKEFNLKNVTLDLPLEIFTIVTGISGSGKSTLIDVVKERLKQQLATPKLYSDGVKKKTTSKKSKPTPNFEKIISITQKPIGRTPRSNPATYTKVWEIIRDLFAQTKEAKIRGYNKGRFSFNVKGGRCEECGGGGVIKVETQIFSPIEVVCDACGGKRFNPSTLDVRYKEMNIYDILEMNFKTAEQFFSSIPKLTKLFSIINQIGLGYLKLGQPSTTLSGGEAQRIKIASELGKPSSGKTIFFLDEPTTGLHFEDIDRLLIALNQLVAQKNTVVVIEHNLDMIKSADHLIELGPKGGDEGGKIVFTGTYEEILKATTPTAESVRTYQTRQNQKETGHFLNRQNFKQLFDTKPKNKLKPANQNQIEIRGLKKHNLKNIDLDLPKNKIIVFTGVSGSGKTSIALDSIFVEGQRKYLESLSTYARRFLGRVSRPESERMDHLSPAIAIDQKKVSKNPRSIIATQTEIYDSLRVLFANIGTPHCHVCDDPLEKYSETMAAKHLIKIPSLKDRSLLILAPIFLSHFQHTYLLDKKSSFPSYIESFKEQGYQRFYLDGEVVKIDDPKLLSKAKKAKKICVVIDRINNDRENLSRINESIEKAYALSNGIVGIAEWSNKANSEDTHFFLLTRFYSCPSYQHNATFREKLTPRHFSFNHSLGACDFCEGIGQQFSIDIDRLFISHEESLLKALDPYISSIIPKQQLNLLKSATKDFKTPILEKKYSELTLLEKDYFFYGVIDLKLGLKLDISLPSDEQNWQGLIPIIALSSYFDEGKKPTITSQENLFTYAQLGGAKLRKFWSETDCFKCRGGRLKPKLLKVKIGGYSIAHLIAQRLPEFSAFFLKLKKQLTASQAQISDDTIDEINFRTSQLLRLGVDYLTLNRKVESLSGGEMQRIRLSTQIGNQLRDTLYVLDEPTVGLHERDNQRLIDVIHSLKNQGNTVMLVEHDASMIKTADHIVDVGPEAGELGGKITYSGKNQTSLLKNTSFYPFIFEKHYNYPREQFSPFSTDKDKSNDYLILSNIYANNLVNQSVSLPLKKLTAISGVSGSGKSSLLEVLHQSLLELSPLSHLFNTEAKKTSSKLIRLHPTAEYFKGGVKKKITNTPNFGEPVNKVYFVEQSPVSLNKRSIILTYMDIYEDIRDLFAKTKTAKSKGYNKGHFSFNSHLGKCPNCNGMGEEEIEMHFISDVTVICEVCQGRRFQSEVLDIYYQGKNIHDVLQMTFTQAIEFFFSFKKITTKIQQLLDAGLGYLKLGFKTSLLSGGELQRLKIAHELAFENPKNAIYLLDEPTTGLHFKDIAKLIKLLESLVLKGATVIVVEHNIEFLRSMDHLIELGPEGGDGGGKVINTGTPKQLKTDQIGHTSKYL